ncbi:MAG: VanZ family protein [Gemmatimonadota bacterium]
MSDARRWAPAMLWGAIILVATSLPGSVLPSAPVIPGVDKVVHGGMYGVLGALVARGMTVRGRVARSGWGWIVAGVVVAGFAAADEWHQQWIPGRGADALDWVADVAPARRRAGQPRLSPS